MSGIQTDVVRTNNTDHSFLENTPALFVTMGQQLLSFGLIGPTCNYGAARFIAPEKASLSFPNSPAKWGKVALTSVVFGTVLTGVNGLPLPQSWKTALHENNLSSGLAKADYGQYLAVFLENGAIGLGGKLMEDFKDPILGGVMSEGRAMTWGIDLGLSLLLIPTMAWALGNVLKPFIVGSAIAVGVLGSLTSSYITQTKKESLSEANAWRQSSFMLQNSFSTLVGARGLAGQMVMSPGRALGTQLFIAACIFGVFYYSLHQDSGQVAASH